MEKKFIVPAVTFLSGLAVWIVFFVLNLWGNLLQGLYLNAALAVVAAGLILFSGISCKKAGGPRMGSIVRASVLFVLAALTYWKVGIIEAGILLAASLALVILTPAAPDKLLKE